MQCESETIRSKVAATTKLVFAGSNLNLVKFTLFVAIVDVQSVKA